MEKDSGGRPTKFKDEYVNMAKVACAEGGFTDAKLAKLFNVVRSTISLWKRTYPEFRKALVAGKDIFDTEVVEKAFLKRCTGFYYSETTREPVPFGTKLDPKTGLEYEISKMAITKRVRKYVVPDAKGCMDWLTNRAPDRWKKSKHVEITGKDGGPVKTQSMVTLPSGPMSIAQWEKEVAEARKNDKPIEPGQIPGNA
jgi:hypothetical protein